MRKITGVRFPDIQVSVGRLFGSTWIFDWSDKWNSYYFASKSRSQIRKYAYATALTYRDKVDA